MCWVTLWGKIRQGKVTKVWPGDETFPRRTFSPTKYFPLLSNAKNIEVVIDDAE